MSVCLVLWAIFCKLINEGSWGATRLYQILFQIGKTFYGDFSDVGTGLWRGLFAPYAMSRVVPAFQIRQNVHRRRPQIWTAFHVNGRRSRWESASCDSWKSSPDSPCEVAEEVGICNKSSCRLILTDKRTMSRVAAKLVPASVDASLPCPWIFDEACDDCCPPPPAALLSRFGPCELFLVTEVEILTKRSPISDGRGDRRKFDEEPSHHPAKHVPGRAPELENFQKNSFSLCTALVFP